jgi:catechol 2,3-dioxygenase-like lactoylglutathione lyase family enzyme
MEDTMLGSIAHVALVVRDTARTAELFKSLFDCKEVSRRDAEGHDEKFVKLGDTWFALVQADMQRSRTGDHIAFKVSKETLEITAQKLQRLQLEHLRARDSTSLYFFDYDNHVFELDTTNLDEELAAET